MSYSKYKEYTSLFNRVNNELTGYYSKKDFIYAIIEKNYNYIMSAVKSIELYCDDDKLVEDLLVVIYEF